MDRWQRASLCNCYGFLQVGRRLGRQPLSFSVIGWTGGSYGVEGHEVEDTRNDMTFLTVLLARREVTTYRLWRDRTKEMFGGVMDQEMGRFFDDEEVLVLVKDAVF